MLLLGLPPEGVERAEPREGCGGQGGREGSCWKLIALVV